FFFFQAEDGIRDRNVTGVQTCALPIWEPEPAPALDAPAPPPSVIEAPAESAEALYGEIQQFVAGVRDLVNDGSVAFPWAGLERLGGKSGVEARGGACSGWCDHGGSTAW